MIKTIVRYLRKRGHVVNEQACAALLGLIALDPSVSTDPIAAANELLAKEVQADLSQFVILRDPVPHVWKTLKMGAFSVGSLDQERMRRRCEKAGSDFYRLYSKRFMHGMTIERSHRPVTVWHFEYARSRFVNRDDASRLQDAWFAMLLEYFEQISALQFELFWGDFNRQQLVLAALGKHHFPDEQGMSPDPWNISIYLGIGDHGYVCPSRNISRLPWLGMDEKITLVVEQLEELFDFKGLMSTNPIHRTIAIYAQFVKRAATLRADARSSDLGARQE